MNDEKPNDRANNPFGALAERPEAQTMTTVASDRQMQEIQAGMVVAKRFPRNAQQATEKIITACTQPALAEVAQYAYQRGGQLISGPSIRLAEVVVQNWGNLWSGVTEIARNRGESIAEAWAWDLETNARDVRTFTVPHWRDTKSGRKPLEDDRDIYEHVANQGARRKRAAIQFVVPTSVFDAACAQCDLTLKKLVKLDQESIDKMVQAFYANFGVTQEQLSRFLGHRLDSMIEAEMLRLKKVYMSLRDGFAKASDFFDPIENQTTSTATEAARGLGGQDGGRQQQPPASQQTTEDQQGDAGASGDDQAGASEEPERDHFGVRWDQRIHTANQAQTKEGRWKRKRGISDAYYEQVMAELIEADRHAGAEDETPQEPTGAAESDDPGQAGEGSAPDPAAGAGEAAGGQDEDPGPPAGMDPETGEVPDQAPDSTADDGGPPDGEIVQRIQRYIPTARKAGDLDMLADLEDEAREIRNEQWRAHVSEQLAEARRAIEAGAS